MPRADGAWAAYYEDRSEVFVFGSELAALRKAVGRSMNVCHWPHGCSLTEAVIAAEAEAAAGPIAPVRARRSRKAGQSVELPTGEVPTPQTGA